jgi:hypothetical protein
MGTFQYRLVITLIAGLFGIGEARAQKFFPDDPIEVLPPAMDVGGPLDRDVNQLYDFLRNSVRPERRPASPAGEVNTLGEVPDNAWFTNRHARKRMTREELQRGPGTDHAPVAPFTVIGGKSDGATPGFRMIDAEKRLYFVKADPLSNPEMASGADVIVSKFLYAAGYNTPENYIVVANVSDFRLSDEARIRASEFQPEEKMTWGDLQDIVNRIPHRPDGSFRIMASYAVEGKPIGPFRFEGSRRDDPNDIVAHENRRDLRGLHVFAAWLNHTDIKAHNTLDTVVEEKGIHFIRHYLIDFGASLGSDSYLPKDPRFGFRYMLPRPGEVWRKMLTFGVVADPWERLEYPDLPTAGNLEAAGFEPEHWTSNYPNPAFLSRQPEDEFWAAKIVTAFSDDDIRAIVETGQFTDPRVIPHITSTLIQRRDKIARAYFSKVLALDQFRIEDGELRFADLGAGYGLRPDAEYRVRWFLFDDRSGKRSPISSSRSVRLPVDAIRSEAGSYLVAILDLPEEPVMDIAITIRKTANGHDVVGIERTAKN